MLNTFKLWSSCARSSVICRQNVFQIQLAGVKTLEEKVGLPPKPKKPLTPYFRYMQDMRSNVMKENPDLSIMDITKLLSKRWELVDDKQKLKYNSDFKKDQVKYVEERAKYDSTITDTQRQEMKQIKQDILDAKERKALKKRVRELGRPKRPASAFLRFIIKERGNTPQSINQTYREWHAKATEKWSRMSDGDKEFFILDARKDYEVYKVKINDWEEKMVKLGHRDVVRNETLIEPTEAKAKRNTPVKHPKPTTHQK